ncbi:hypothetical protein PR048_016502 [Dryococelus australis]|uniref:Uncharacterized protein n=1 Tax=Dryococelus australis TaxID=614101 RepID=A0ABQ9HJX3_9NEOP|nr:hypothetical protein PR048_016502 [Dryococelus australis]
MSPGFNPDVLNTLLKFYINTPKHKDGVEMKPFIDHNVMHIAGIEDKERREWWESQFKYMYSGRPRQRLPYEVYHWEKIYKIDHKTKPLDKRTRPFELPDVNPSKRRYDDHAPKYMPRKLRPEGREKGRNKINFYKTFYNT